MTFQDLLAREFEPYGTLSNEQLALLESHYRLLLRWNQKLNLTRIEHLEEAIHLHYCESLFLATLLPAGPLRIADIGSGAGFPGIPVAVFRPECSVTLIESHQRKAVFLREASRGLQNVAVIAARAEDLSHTGTHTIDDTGVSADIRGAGPQPAEMTTTKPAQEFDWLISRAVAPAEVLKLSLARRMALLVGGEEAAHLRNATRVPWGKDRFAVIVPSGTVPRETS